MSDELVYASNLKIEEVIITGVDGDSFDITPLVIRFDYFEDISLPTISANLDLVDSGENLISSLPIQGYEDISIKARDVGEQEIEYEFKVYKIYNRYMGDRFQRYSLGLISREALINETVKVPRSLAGKPEGIVSSLLSTELGSGKRVYTDPSLFKIRFLPGKRTPFSIIESIRMKCIAETSKTTRNTSTTGSDTQKSVGTAGYYFFENKNGYYFSSIDRLNSLEKNPPQEVFTQENADIGGSPQRKILDIDFQQEIDVLTKLRMGTFSNVICFYNYSTGAYEEYTYNLADSFDDQEHLGSQSGLAKGQADLGENPSRFMSVLIDHETWFDGEEVASPEKKDGGGQNTAEFPDWQKNYVAQSIARLESQNNQQVRIQVPIRIDLCVGNTVEIQIPNQIPSAERQPDVYDPEHSGVYLIAKLNHAVDVKNAKANTYLTLVRDSYGRPEEPSGTATK